MWCSAASLVQALTILVAFPWVCLFSSLILQNMAAFTIGYQNGYSDAKKANAPGGKGFAAAYKTGLNKGLSHEENHLQFLASMRRAKEAYYAATGGGGGGAAGGGAPMPMAMSSPIDTGAL